MQPNPFGASLSPEQLELLKQLAGGRSPAGAMSASEGMSTGAAPAPVPSPAVAPKPLITPPVSQKPVVPKAKPQQAAPVSRPPAELPSMSIPGMGKISAQGSSGLAPNEDVIENLMKVNRERSQKLNTLYPIEDMRLREQAGMDSEAYKMQGQSVDEMKALLQQRLGQRTQVNLKPLAALMDSWYGSKLAAGYTEPETAAGKLDKMAAYQTQIANQRDKMVDNLTNYQKNFKGGGTISDQLQELLQSRQSYGHKAFDPNAANRGETADDSLVYRMGKDVKADSQKLQNSFGGAMKDYATIDSAFASRNSTQVSNALNLFAKNVAGQKGVLTEGDMQRTLPANFYGFLAKMQAYASKNPSADLPEEYTTELEALMTEVKKNTVNEYNFQIKSLVNATKANPAIRKRGIPVDDIVKDAVDLGKQYENQPAPKPNTGPMGDLDEWSRMYDAQKAGK